jgi:hypothetical protein
MAPECPAGIPGGQFILGPHNAGENHRGTGVAAPRRRPPSDPRAAGSRGIAQVPNRTPYLVTAFTIDLIRVPTAPTAAPAMATRSRLCLRVMMASRRRDRLSGSRAADAVGICGPRPSSSADGRERHHLASVRSLSRSRRPAAGAGLWRSSRFMHGLSVTRAFPVWNNGWEMAGDLGGVGHVEHHEAGALTVFRPHAVGGLGGELLGNGRPDQEPGPRRLSHSYAGPYPPSFPSRVRGSSAAPSSAVTPCPDTGRGCGAFRPGRTWPGTRWCSSRRAPKARQGTCSAAGRPSQPGSPSVLERQ